MQNFHSTTLADAGLNLQAVFDISTLPDPVLQVLTEHCDNLDEFTQLLLLGHGGRSLWKNVKSSKTTSDHPIDDYSINTINAYFAKELPTRQLTFIYPGTAPIGLQKLGELAGWHYTSPFRVGINAHWGSWFAYRAVVLSDTCFTPSQAIDSVSPCTNCKEKPCLDACPSAALSINDFTLKNCLDYRQKPDSQCIDTCLSRLSCPVGSAHRYTDEQINYHYNRSITVIRHYFNT